MASSLSNLVDNLAEGIQKIKWKRGNDNKCKTCGIKHKDCECCLEYSNGKVDLILYKCLCCNMNYQKKFNKNLEKRFANTHKFLNMISVSLFCCYWNLEPFRGGNVFNNFQNMYLEIKAWSCSFSLAPGLAWQAVLKKICYVKLDMLTDSGMLLSVENGIT